MKEYTEAARLRKQLLEGDGGDDVAGGGGGNEYEQDDNYSQSSTEETPRQSMSLLSNNSNKTTPTGGVQVKMEPTTATVTLQELPGQKMDHAKIISEVMKKYPHLLKNNKNIKLKITQKTPSAAGTSFTVRAEAASPTGPPSSSTQAGSGGAGKASNTTPTGTGTSSSTPLGRALLASKQQQQTPTHTPGRVGRPPSAATLASRSLLAKQQSAAVAAAPVAAAPAPATTTPPVRGNRIDSRTMHKLIAMGAENMEGPWLCLRCGVDGKPIGIPTYRAFRK